MIGRGEGEGDGERCKQRYKHLFFLSVLLQLVSVFFVLNGQLLNKHQMRLLLQNPGGTFLQIQTDT